MQALLDLLGEFGISGIVRALWAPSLITLAVFAIVGAVSVWAALSRRHWFTRAVVVAAVLSTALAIRGHDVVLVLLLQSTVAIAGIGALRILRTRPPQACENAGPGYFQFSLLDLMLMVLLVASVCALVVQTPPPLRVEWPAIVIVGLSFGGLTFWLRREFAAVIFGHKRPEWLARKPIRGRLHLTFRLFVSVILPACVTLLLFPAAYVYHRVINPLPRPTVVIPVPNGYEDLVRAGEMLNNVTVPEFGTATPEELRAFVQDNIEVFETTRRGLSRECLATLTYNQSEIVRCGGFRQLMRALIAEGGLAEAEGRPGDAVTSYLDAIRLAEAISRGGIISDRLSGTGIEITVVSLLARIIEAVPRRDANRAIDLLQAIDARRESPEEVLTRDRIWEEHSADGKLWRAGVVLYSYSPEHTSHPEKMSFGMKQSQAWARLEICKLAILRYRLDQDRLPDTLADLVPEYIGSVPQDPFGGQPIVYRPDSTGPILYSIGPDGRDDDGKPMEQLDWFSSRFAVGPGDVLPRDPQLSAEEPVEAE